MINKINLNNNIQSKIDLINNNKSDYKKWQKLVTENETKNNNQNKLKEVSQQIESIFLKMMYKEMKKGLGKNNILKINQGQKIFSDMLLDKRSRINAKYSSIGLSDIIYNQYKKTL